MLQKIFSKILSSMPQIVALLFIGAIAVYAWQEPGQAPPEGNVPAPLNVGPLGQSKEGGLILNTGGAATGLIVDKGDVIIKGALYANLKQIIENFTVTEQEAITAGDIVSFLENGKVKKGVGTTFGPKKQLGQGAVRVAAAALSSDKFAMAYYVYAQGSKGRVVIGSIGSGNTITFGPEIEFSDTVTVYFGLVSLSSDKIVIAYRKKIGPEQYRGRAIVGNVSGNNISFGQEYEFEPDDLTNISMAALSSEEFVMIYHSKDIYYSSAVRVGKVVGTDLTFGGRVSLGNQDTHGIRDAVAVLASDKFVAVFQSYQMDPVNYAGYAVIGTVSDLTITKGNSYGFRYSNSDLNPVVAVLGPDKFIIAYNRYNQDDKGEGGAAIGQVSGTSITFGSDFIFTPAYYDPYDISIANLSSSKFIIAFRAQNGGNAVLGEISVNSLVFGQIEKFETVNTSYNSTIALSPIKFLIAYNVPGMSQAFVGAIPGKILGVAKESKIGGEFLPVIINGVSDLHSGLTVNSIYYADKDGLTLSSTPYCVGLAISATKILLGKCE